ncbi:alpha/beta hydrolase [Portibacter marinus]|uniref:alpha/beta hydrolase n=1 Tax=Portibacter marinus TaxID=2898660 RepID=UPI001F2DEA16|nr:alpha/beta fold hydrolase [Portibacter marinus]
MKNVAVLFMFLIGIQQCKDSSEVKPNYDFDFREIEKPLKSLQDSIAMAESNFPIREDNQARIDFYNNQPIKTDYSVVYLHGFAGSYMDGFPANQIIADTLKANVYHARWGDHGQFPPHSMEDFTPENSWEDAKEALAIGNAIGKKTIIMSTSTGGTLATLLAAKYPEKVHAIINISPNYKDDQTGAGILNTLIGEEVAHIVAGGENRKLEFKEPKADLYWDTLYPAEALSHLQNLVQTTMKPETFSEVTVPLLLVYYKKNIIQEDSHVEVDIFPKIFKQFSTPDSLKVLKPMDQPETHFMGSEIKTSQYPLTVEVIISFLRNQLNIEI